jgi:hypothetical protein
LSFDLNGCSYFLIGDALCRELPLSDNVRLQLCYASPIEFAYYASTIGRKDICCHCAKEDVRPDKEVEKNFHIVLPICDNCKSAGKKYASVDHDHNCPKN